MKVPQTDSAFIEDALVGLNDAELDRLRELTSRAATNSSRAIVERVLAAAYAERGSPPRVGFDRQFNRCLSRIVDTLDDVTCAVMGLLGRWSNPER